MKPVDEKYIKSFFENEGIDYFISSSSFEDRSFVLSSVVHDLEIEEFFIFGTVDFHDEIEENRNKQLNFLIQSKQKVEAVDLKINDPVFSFINMSKMCKKIFSGKSRKILFDITTFTHENLLMLFRLLLHYKRNVDKIIITYVGAKEYSYNEPTEELKWLTKGVKEIRSIIGYPGYTDPTKKNHLIILFGFEKERTIRLIEDFDFDLVSLAFGSKTDSISIGHQSINEIRHQEILSVYSEIKKFEISLTDPVLTKNQLLEYISHYKDYNIVIAPMNNKVSTIGAGLAALENLEIQLFYIQANIYNIEAYSVTGDDFYIFELR